MLTGSIPSILSLGLGNGVFAGSPSLVLTLGFGAGEAVTPSATASWAYCIFSGNKGHVAFKENKGHVVLNSQP